jgi:hypothetical protein
VTAGGRPTGADAQKTGLTVGEPLTLDLDQIVTIRVDGPDPDDLVV